MSRKKVGVEDVANYQDPTPGKMGWGVEERNPLQNLAVEAAMVEQIPVVCTARDAEGATAIDPDIEKALRAKFKFDEGWSFFVAEQIVYGFGDLETWMIAQLIGNCVGASHCGLLAARIAHEVLAEGDLEEPLGKLNLGGPFIPYSYGVGRWEGGMLGPGDGSYCGAQMEGTLKHGFLPCFSEGLDKLSGSGDAALPQGTSSVNRKFGSSKSELQKWEPKAVKFKMNEAPEAKTADDAKELVVDKKIPLQICSGWGFAYDRFDSKYGVHLYRKSGSWSHSMQVMAIFAIKGQWFVCIRNQWGYSSHRGSPEIGIPPGCFVIPFELFASWVRSAEVMGIGEIEGIPSNPGS